MGVGEAIIGVSPAKIGVSGGGSRLAQITVVGLGFAGRGLLLRRSLSLSLGCRDRERERKNVRMYHSLPVDWVHLLRKKDTRFLRNTRKDWRVDFIPSGGCMCDTRVMEGAKM